MNFHPADNFSANNSFYPDDADYKEPSAEELAAEIEEQRLAAERATAGLCMFCGVRAHNATGYCNLCLCEMAAAESACK